MQPIVRWLVQRPQNAVMGLAASFLLPLAPVLSGAVMVLITLQLGAAKAAIVAGMSALLLAAIALALGASMSELLGNVIVIWLPGVLLATLLQRWQSVTLVMQVTVILAALTLVAATVAVGDTVAFGLRMLEQLSATMAAAGLQQQADVLLVAKNEMAPQMLFLLVFLAWQASTVAVLAGNALSGSLVGSDASYGRFCDLNFGRVLAMLAAVLSVVGWLSGVALLQQLALFLFVAFWMQGLSLVHWLKQQGRLPGVVLVVLYASLPILHVLPLVGLALSGYVDAWMNFRRRAAA